MKLANKLPKEVNEVVEALFKVSSYGTEGSSGLAVLAAAGAVRLLNIVHPSALRNILCLTECIPKFRSRSLILTTFDVEASTVCVKFREV